MATAREEQVARLQARMEIIERLREIPDSELSTMLEDRWKRYRELRDEMEPLHYEALKRRVKAVAPEAVSLVVQSSDQDSGQWIYDHVVTSAGVTVEGIADDTLSDDHELWSMLGDLSLFFPVNESGSYALDLETATTYEEQPS